DADSHGGGGPRRAWPDEAAAQPSLLQEVIIDTDGVRSELAEPYDILLSPQLRCLALRPHRKRQTSQISEPDWSLWETCYNENEPRRPSGRRGSKTEAVMGLRGRLSNLPDRLKLALEDAPGSFPRYAERLNRSSPVKITHVEASPRHLGG